MRSSVEIVAERSGGRTVLRRLRAGGHFALRQTGPVQVHLVGTAAGPLGGDEIDVRIDVGAGAELAVRGVAATIILPSAEASDSVIRLDADVAEGGRLDLALRPTVVCAGAEHLAVIRLRLAADACADVVEQVVLGRAAETGGCWTGRTAVVRDGVPVLRHTLHSDLLGAPGTRALLTWLTSVAAGHADPAAATVAGTATLLPLAAGGVLRTATGPDLTSARRDLAATVGVDLPA